MATLCSSCHVPNGTDHLVTLLQDSISCVHEDAFHPVLYQALAGLHEYIGSHQRRMMQGSAASSIDLLLPTTERTWKKTRPSFCRESHREDGVVASGWLEEMVASNDDTGGVNWKPVLLLMVIPGLEDDDSKSVTHEEPYLGIAYENDPHSSHQARKRISLSSLFCDYEDVYGDPRLTLGITGSDGAGIGEVITLRCDRASAARSWVSELRGFVQDDTVADEPCAMVDQSVEVEIGENFANVIYDTTRPDGDAETGSIETDVVQPEAEEGSVEKKQASDNDIPAKPETKTTNKPSQETTAPEKAKQSIASVPSKEDAEEKHQELDVITQDGTAKETVLKQETGKEVEKQLQGVQQKGTQQSVDVQKSKAQQAPQPTQQQPPQAQQKQSQVQRASALLQKQEPAQNSQVQQQQQQHSAHRQRMYQQQQQQRFLQQQRLQQQQQQKLQQQKQAAAPQKPATAPQPAATTQAGKEMRVEQQKKLAAERRRLALNLQRKLAREEQKKKDLEGKRKFLEKELRKQELVAKAQRPSSNNDTSDNLRQISQQISEVDAEIKLAQSSVEAIKVEIEQRKHQPLQSAASQTAQPTSAAAAAAKKRIDEQAQKVQNLEAQKKAAVEKRRQELEEQRRRAREAQKKKDEEKKRQEQRKHDLIAKAKVGKSHLGDSALLKKLNNQMTALDAEAEQRAEEAKEEAAKEATGSQEDQEDDKDDPEAARKRIAEQARQRDLQEEIRRNPSPAIEKRKSPRINLVPSASSEDGGLGNGFGQQAYTPSASSTVDPFQHLQNPGQSTQYQQQPLHNTPQMQGVAPGHQQYQQTHQRSHTSPFLHSTTPPVSPLHYPSHAQQQPQQPVYQTPHTQPQPSHQKARASPPSPSPQPPPSSGGLNQKYGKMAAQNDDDGQSALTELKRKIIVGWALQPPEMQALRPINELLRTIQTVYPPANGLPSHTHFDGWKTVLDSDLQEGQTLDEKKLSKAVRKLRFFLHPDKLPRDLTEEQQFVCKLLWDITNDSFAEYKKALEDLDWMNN